MRKKGVCGKTYLDQGSCMGGGESIGDVLDARGDPFGEDNGFGVVFGYGISTPDRLFQQRHLSVQHSFAITDVSRSRPSAINQQDAITPNS